MNFRVFVGAVPVCVLITVPTMAQQDPHDLGAADAVVMTVSTTDVLADDSTFTAEMFFFNDRQNIVSCSMGFEWDNPKVVMDSAVWETPALAAFNAYQIMYFKDNLDSTNYYRRFQCVGLRTAGLGLPAAPAPAKIVTYYFHVEDWLVTDTAAIRKADFNAFRFVDPQNEEYSPLWSGDYAVYNADRGEPFLLKVSPGTLKVDDPSGELGSADRQEWTNINQHNIR